MEERARQLVLAHGWNATAYQILNPGIEHWFSTRADAVVGFVRRRKTWVVAGAPVCAPSQLAEVTQEFESAARTARCRVCYVGAAERLAQLFANSTRHARVAIGAQPVWSPRDWGSIVRERPSLRAQLSRARNKRIIVRQQNPNALRTDDRLKRCLHEWLTARPLPEMHFLVEPETFSGELSDRLLFVAEATQGEGRPVAFLLASPVPQRKGFLVEQIIRSPAAPNGTAELLIDALMHHLTERGDDYLSMGLVPLALHAHNEIRKNPLWLRALMAWARAHGRRFYHFDGLESFRQKMAPARWETLYAITNEPRFTPAAFYALVAAFCEGSVTNMVLRGLGRAAQTELKNIVRA